MIFRPSLFRELTLSSARRSCPLPVRESLRSNRVPPQGLAATARRKSADSLDVVASRDLIRTRIPRPGLRSCYSALRLHLHTQIIKNDTCGWERLSKIAHL